MQRMAMASRVNIALPCRPLSPAFSVEQCSSDAVTRGGKFVSLADFFDVERNPATILSRGTVDPLGSEHLVFLSTAPRLG